MSKKLRDALLIGAAVLLAAALIWGMDIARDDPLRALADELNAYGLELRAEDFYVLGGAEDTTIAALMEEKYIEPMTAASSLAGFPSDAYATGDITALLANTEKGVLTVYLRDGAVEIAFIQTEEGEVLSLT